MMIVFYILLGLLGIYAGMLSWMALGFVMTRSAAPVATAQVGEHASVVICARNEENNIRHCLNSILAQECDWKNTTVILVDDASTDRTYTIGSEMLKKNGLRHHLVRNEARLGKKASIAKALELVSAGVVILRDADTFTTSKTWLKTILQRSPNDSFIIGPVAIANYSGLLWALQAIENNILAVLSCGSAYFRTPFLSSGANLAFRKEVYSAVDGFRSHAHIPSGDDVLFMEDVRKKTSSKISYLKNTASLVVTFPVLDLEKLIRQRIRWASKFRYNSSFLNSGLAFLVLAVNASWLFCCFYIALTVHFKMYCVVFILFKVLIDLLLLLLASSFLRNKNLWWYVLPVAIIYPLYALVVGIGSVTKKTNWK